MKPIDAGILTLAALLIATDARARSYTAPELSAPPAAALSPADNDEAVTRGVRRDLADCLKSPGDRTVCLAVSAGHCPPNIQVYVCANSEYIVWQDYIGFYLSILRGSGKLHDTAALGRAQRAWETFAQAQCNYVGQFWLDVEPRMRSMSVVGCKRDEAGHRALSLRDDVLNLATQD